MRPKVKSSGLFREVWTRHSQRERERERSCRAPLQQCSWLVDWGGLKQQQRTTCVAGSWPAARLSAEFDVSLLQSTKPPLWWRMARQICVQVLNDHSNSSESLSKPLVFHHPLCPTMSNVEVETGNESGSGSERIGRISRYDQSCLQGSILCGSEFVLEPENDCNLISGWFDCPVKEKGGEQKW